MVSFSCCTTKVLLASFGQLLMTVTVIHLVLLLLTKLSQDGLMICKVYNKVGVLSTFLYLVFINDLVNSIEQLYTCTKLLNVICNCPSLADDISLIALTPNSLQNMLDVANTYSRRWRFKFNANKSSILQFLLKGNQLKEGNIWTLGDTPVPCSDSCT